MKGLITLLVASLFVGSVHARESTGPLWNGTNWVEYLCIRSFFVSGGTWHCSHHPLTLEALERLECLDPNCDTKQDYKTGDKFTFSKVWVYSGVEPKAKYIPGYLHLHD